jgi:2-keto-3-deoxy-6-phosphogluconate aldolase
MAHYLRSPLILAVGGSWIARRVKIAAGAWDEIIQTAAEAVARIEEVRGQ